MSDSTDRVRAKAARLMAFTDQEWVSIRSRKADLDRIFREGPRPEDGVLVRLVTMLVLAELTRRDSEELLLQAELLGDG